jgi:hypothetical protein
MGYETMKKTKRNDYYKSQDSGSSREEVVMGRCMGERGRVFEGTSNIPFCNLNNRFMVVRFIIILYVHIHCKLLQYI